MVYEEFLCSYLNLALRKKGFKEKWLGSSSYSRKCAWQTTASASEFFDCKVTQDNCSWAVWWWVQQHESKLSGVFAKQRLITQHVWGAKYTFRPLFSTRRHTAKSSVWSILGSVVKKRTNFWYFWVDEWSYKMEQIHVWPHCCYVYCATTSSIHMSVLLLRRKVWYAHVGIIGVVFGRRAHVLREEPSSSKYTETCT